MKKTLFTLTALLTILCSCGNKTSQNQSVHNDDSEQAYYIRRDTTIYGFCAEGSAMNTLQIITDAGDTITVSTVKAREKNKVFGGYAIGDEMAILTNADTTEALIVINKSMLNGDWVMPNPLDGSSETGIRILRGGAAESIDQSSIVYKSWRIFNGMLQIIATREDGIDMEEYMLYDILKLTPDSLVFRTANGDENDKETFEYGHPSGDTYGDLGITLDDGTNDEFDM